MKRILPLLLAIALPAFAVETKAASASYQNVTTEYIALNALRREPFVSYLNADNFTRTFYNTTVFDQLPVLNYNADLEKTAKVRAKEIVTEVMLAFAEADKPYSGQGHRRNMLNPNFNAVGCACYKVGNYCYWVQCFGRV